MYSALVLDDVEQLASVERILRELSLGEKRRLLVWNKRDRLPAGEAEAIARAHGGMAVSAQDRASLAPLLAQMERALWEEDALVDGDAARPAASAT